MLNEDKERLLNSDNFCMLPFIHTAFLSNGNIRPCCVYHGKPLGNLKENKIQDIIDPSINSKVKGFRNLFLLENTPLPTGCKGCVRDRTNGSSYRVMSNNRFGYLLDTFETIEDLRNNTNIYYIDMRFSNLCNLRCVYCWHFDSSRVGEDILAGNEQIYGVYYDGKSAVGDSPLKKNFNTPEQLEDFLEFFKKNLSNLSMLYFTGGEPTLVKEHYDVLELLIQAGNTDIQLMYNSNVSTKLALGDRSIIDYWKHFSKVGINLSIDCAGEPLEYARDGADWELILKNVREIKKALPSVKLSMTPVVNALSIYEIPEAYHFMKSEGLVDSLNVQRVGGNEDINAGILPERYKDEIRYLYSKYTDQYPELKYISDVCLGEETDPSMRTDLLKKFKKRTELIKEQRGKDFYKIFPYYKDLFNGIE